MNDKTIIREIHDEVKERMERSESALMTLSGLRSNAGYRDAVDAILANFMAETGAPSRSRSEDVSPEYIVGYMHALDLFVHPESHLNRLRSEQRKMEAKYEYVNSNTADTTSRPF